MRLAGLNTIGKGVGNVAIPSVGKIPAFIGWIYKIVTSGAKCCNQEQISEDKKMTKPCLMSCS